MLITIAIFRTGSLLEQFFCVLELGMKVILIVSVLIGGTFSAPAKLDSLHHTHSNNHHPHHHGDGNVHHSHSPGSGYSYPEPAQPVNLYEVPKPKEPSGLYEAPATTTTTTTAPPPPPPPPQTDYLPPQPSNQYFVPEPAKPMKMMLMPYNFRYNVADADTMYGKSGAQFSHSETSDGRDVKGEYSVMLPDGRLQVVKFTSNPDDGYVAHVSYQ